MFNSPWREQSNPWLLTKYVILSIFQEIGFKCSEDLFLDCSPSKPSEGVQSRWFELCMSTIGQDLASVPTSKTFFIRFFFQGEIVFDPTHSPYSKALQEHGRFWLDLSVFPVSSSKIELFFSTRRFFHCRM